MSVNIPLALANIQYQTLGLLLDRGTTTSANDANGASFLDMLDSLGGISDSDTALSDKGVLSTGSTSALDNFFGDGSNLLLQAFNARETSYSKELARLDEMQDEIADLSATAKSLQAITTDSSNADIKSALQDFVQQYNAWDTEFDADVGTGGKLQDSQPANMARFSMLRDVNDIFNGRGNGGLGSGMSELGIEVGADGQIRFDTAKFDQAMATDKTAAVKTIINMAQSMSRDADSLASDGKPLANRIDRLEDALGFIDENKPSIEAQASAAAMYQSMLRL